MKFGDMMHGENAANEQASTLGDDIHILGIDPGPEDSEDSISLREKRISDWIGRSGDEGESISDILGRAVNTVAPYGTAGNCHSELFVPVTRSVDIAARLADSTKHFTLCPETNVVVFLIGGSVGYLEWMKEFLLWKLKHASHHRSIVVRVTAAWAPRPGLHNGVASQQWAGGISSHVNQNGNAVPGIRSNRAAFRHRVWLLEELGVLGADSNYVALHTNQPPITGGQGADISFGTRRGEKITRWQARIYLPDNGNAHYRERFPLGFPIRSLDPTFSTGNGFKSTKAQSTCKNSWSPIQQEPFIQNPYAYLDKQQFPHSR